MGEALYTFVSCLLALALSGLAAYAAKQPLLFPRTDGATLLRVAYGRNLEPA